MKITLLLNSNLNFIFLEKNKYKYIIIFNKNKNLYIKYIFNKYSKIHYIKNLNCIVVKLKHFNLNINNFNCILNKQIKSIDFYFYKKIQFLGKGFKIKKLKKKILNLFFNRSHITFLK
jgi:ribosomal protein L6P/L9E